MKKNLIWIGLLFLFSINSYADTQLFSCRIEKFTEINLIKTSDNFVILNLIEADRYREISHILNSSKELLVASEDEAVVSKAQDGNQKITLSFDGIYGASVVNLLITSKSLEISGEGPALNVLKDRVGSALDTDMSYGDCSVVIKQ